MPIIPLVAPDSSPIVGIKLNDGSVIPLQCNFSRPGGNPTFLYMLPEGAVGYLMTNRGNNILVDANGREWASSDVEFESTPPM